MSEGPTCDADFGEAQWRRGWGPGPQAVSAPPGGRTDSAIGALGRSQHGAGVGGLLHEAAHLLAEVHVVHRHERAEPFARRAGQRAEHRAPDVVVRVGVQTVDAQHAGAVVEDDEVVGDGGDLDHPGTVAPQARLHGMTEPALDRVLIYHNTN